MRIVLDLQACQSASRYRGIGRYALALGKAIARQCGSHEVMIALNGGMPGTVEPIRAEFDGLVAQQNIRTWLVPTPTAGIDPTNAWRARVAEPAREAFLASLAPDVLHVGSLFEGLVDDSVTSIGHDAALAARSAATFYDLIPLQYPEHYLQDRRVREWYTRKVASLRRAPLLLSISESSRREAIELLQVPEEVVVTISSGVDALFRQRQISTERTAELRARYGLRRRGVLYAGGMDPRKNVPALVAAFARLPAEIRGTHQLLLVGNLDERERELLMAIARRAGLGADELVIAGYVSDVDLVDLYNLSELFVFPSLHEGFGLPALEAMACGLPVVASNRSSLPEAVGRADALFDPTSVDDIAAKMAQVLGDDAFRSELRRHGPAHSARFSWDECARRAVSAMERLQRDAVPRPAKTTAPRPRLAVLTPLPPERTGIADYSAALLPYLARHYEIDVVVGPSDQPRPASIGGLPVRSSAWFVENAGSFERVLYHMGNSPYHTYMLDLLPKHPGVVVLHDFFMGNLARYLELTGERSGFWTRSLYESHGYPALVQRVLNDRQGDDDPTKYAFPCNAPVLRNAEGVLVHSRYSDALANAWYGDCLAQPWHVVPFPRALPEPGSRAQARAELGLQPDDFVVCSFGMVGATKCTHRLIAAWGASALSGRTACKLVFVGENDGGEYGREMAGAIAAAPADSIRITGFVSAQDYRRYLEAADACVQLRTLSRGETSAAVMDALAHGLPTILNANGAMAEIDPDAVVLLPDDFDDDALRSALESLEADPALRARLSGRARGLVATRHDPAHVAASYRDAIEQAVVRGPHTALTQAVSRIAGVGKAGTEEGANWPALAACVARNQRPAFPARQVFVDISNLVREDLKTGIERVVRGVLLALIQEPVEGCRVEPVYADGEGVYRYARRFCAGLIGADGEWFEDEPLEYSSGDAYLALDLAQHNVPNHRAFFEELRDAGVGLYFVMYDVLPMRRPDFFPEWLQPVFSAWLDAVTAIADGVACISRAVSDDLLAELRRLHPARLRPLRIGAFPLGSDLQASLPTSGIEPEAEAFLRRTAGRTRLLMVGTVEPRKGHAQVLDAFEALWARGSDACLVIVGKTGWMVDALVARLRNHDEAGRRLFWFNKASDEFLEALYRDCSALLMASEGEGFGLPLIEAARHALPIVCRDLPVFREVAGTHAFYFSAHDGAGLAAAIEQWIAMAAAGEAPASAGIPETTWTESARALLALVLQSRWHEAWLPDGRYWFPANDARLKSDVGEQAGARYRSTGRAGSLVEGPGQRFGAGAYRVRAFGHWLEPAGLLSLEVVHAGTGVSVLEVSLDSSAAAGGLLAEADFVLSAEVSDLQLRLRVDETARVEFSGFEMDHLGGGFELHAYHSPADPASVRGAVRGIATAVAATEVANMEKVG